VFSSCGILKYDPAFDKQKVMEPFWLIILCDDEISRYYRHWVFKHCCIKLARPLWHAHISIIKNEPVKNASLWGRLRAGQKIKFQYEHRVATNGKHYWLPVKCPDMLDLREEYGLARESWFGLHLTIGNDSV
jgi:hypothetical protein